MEVIPLDKNKTKYTLKLTEEELTMIFDVFTELADTKNIQVYCLMDTEPLIVSKTGNLQVFSAQSHIRRNRLWPMKISRNLTEKTLHSLLSPYSLLLTGL